MDYKLRNPNDMADEERYAEIITILAGAIIRHGVSPYNQSNSLKNERSLTGLSSASKHSCPNRKSYFGGTRKGRRGRGAAGKVPVFGILKRGGKVYTQVIPDASGRTLIPIIEKRIMPDSIVYSDCWRGYDVLDVSKFKHYRINHSVLFADRKNHINGIENFWNQAKRRMRKFNGIPAKHFSSAYP